MAGHLEKSSPELSSGERLSCAPGSEQGWRRYEKPKQFTQLRSGFPQRLDKVAVLLSNASLVPWSRCLYRVAVSPKSAFPREASTGTLPCSAIRGFVTRKDEEKIKEPPPGQFWPPYSRGICFSTSSALQLMGASTPAPPLREDGPWEQ